ncbi:MAG: DUF4153 domain-containing protein [Candidatus Latescibacterota bacterium]|nr:MAG: DUF4153 domain-containing protein [Candidatus Latescibacterota bacterium]
MRFPAFQNLRTAAFESFIRFPFVLLAGAVAAVAGMDMVSTDPDFTWVRVFLAAQLGIALFFAIAIAAEVYGWPRHLLYPVSLVAATALTGYGFIPSEKLIILTTTRHLQLTAGLHLLVAFVPFVAPGLMNGFWQYNRALFLRFCLSALYSIVLFGGLSVALAAIDQLLGIKVAEKVYFRLWMAIAMVFNTWVFVGGVPKDILGLESSSEYTKGLRVFAQYILVPLVIIYLVILTTYLGKIIITRVWPSGWLGYLVSSVAVVGILAHLLVYPMRANAESQWVRTYSRWYYAAMIPAIVMLLLAIGKRIAQYGVTENRYILAVLAGWLALISLYYIFTRARNIKLIPITLCVVAFGTSFGPWGAFSVSERSQMSRLTNLLEKNDLLSDGAIQIAAADVSFEDRKEISAVLDYLVSAHGTEKIAPWFGDRWTVIDTTGYEDDHDGARALDRELVRGMMNEMGIEYVSKWNKPLTEGESFSVRVDSYTDVFALESADYLVRIDAPGSTVIIEEPARSMSWDHDRQSLVLAIDEDTLVIDMGKWIANVLPTLTGPRGSGTMTRDQARLIAKNHRAHAIVHVDTISGEINEGVAEIKDIRGICLLRWLD